MKNAPPMPQRRRPTADQPRPLEPPRPAFIPPPMEESFETLQRGSPQGPPAGQYGNLYANNHYDNGYGNYQSDYNSNYNAYYDNGQYNNQYGYQQDNYAADYRSEYANLYTDDYSSYADPYANQYDKQNNMAYNQKISSDPLVDAPPPSAKRSCLSRICCFRCCCCCGFRTLRGRMIALIVSAALFIAALVLGYFFYPRFPSFVVYDAQVVPNSQGIGPSMTGGFAVSLGMVLFVSVKNPNPYHFRVESINLGASLVPNSSQLAGVSLAQNAQPLMVPTGFSTPIGTGAYPTYIIFPPTQNTTFTMNFTLAYTTQTPLNQDVALGELLQSCGFLGNGVRAMDIHYKANAIVAIFQRFGYTPAFEGDIRVNCPGPISTALASFNLASFGLNTSPPNANAQNVPASTSNAAVSRVSLSSLFARDLELQSDSQSIVQLPI